MQPNKDCVPSKLNDFARLPYLYLYRKFEEALIQNHTVLNEARAALINIELSIIEFEVQLEVVDGNNVSCAEHDSKLNKAFCSNSSSPDYTWKLCPLSDNDGGTLSMSFEAKKYQDLSFILLLSGLHGSAFLWIIPFCYH